MDELSSAMLGAILRLVFTAIREQIATLIPARIATTSDVHVPEEEAEEGAPVPAPAPPILKGRGLPPSLLRRSPHTGSRTSGASKRACRMLDTRLKGTPRTNDKTSLH
ncbi:UNVERIFIED_CONTAM: hypothetical protein Slati_0178900 [Sesamum latifolium]|uniref:Uncharacterized protein n=1 Tax=Sesamum latifolium TaxID=2727402 RepID=A0AAW2YAK7_9LAMI